MLSSLLIVWMGASVAAQRDSHAPQQPATQPAGDHGRPQSAQGDPHGRAEATTAEGEHHEEGIWPLVAKLLNFAILAGALVYFLRSPLMQYFAARGEQIRSDLVRAAEMREEATRQLAEIDRRLQALPADVAALRARGTEDVAAEEARIRAAAEAERTRLLEQTRREIDMQLRVAKRELTREAAGLAVGVAERRIVRDLTPEDQARLVDRYVAQMGRPRG